MVRGTVTGLSSGPVKVMDKALTCALPPPPLRHNLECARIQTADDMRASYPEIWVLFDHPCSARIHRKLPARLLSRCPCRLQVHEFIVTGFLDIAMSVFRTVGGNSSDLWAWIVGTFDEAGKPSRPHSVGLAGRACRWYLDDALHASPPHFRPTTCRQPLSEMATAWSTFLMEKAG